MLGQIPQLGICPTKSTQLGEAGPVGAQAAQTCPTFNTISL